MEEGRKFTNIAEVDPDRQGGSISNFPSPRQADLLRDRTRKLAAQARGEDGPNVLLTPEESRIAGDRIE